MPVNVRAVRLQDAEPMVRLSLAARRQAYVGILKGAAGEAFLKNHQYTPHALSAFRRSLEKYCTMPEVFVAYVAESDADGVVGYIKAKLTPSSVYISNLYVDPLKQGHGIGGILLNEVMALSNGRPIILDVVRENELAVAFYASRGFEKVDDTVKSYYSLPMIRMRKG